MNDVLDGRELTGGQIALRAEQIASAINDRRRTTAIMVISAAALQNFNDDSLLVWPGLLSTVVVDEPTRRAIANKLSLLDIPPAGARLFPAARDNLPNTRFTANEISIAALQVVFADLLITRQSTQLPSDWITDRELRQWWYGDPFAQPAPVYRDPTVEAEIQRGRSEIVARDRQLRELEHRHALTTHMLNATTARVHDLETDNNRLRETLAAEGDPHRGKFAARLASASAEARLEWERAERASEELDWIYPRYGRVTGALATLRPQDAVEILHAIPPGFASFPELLAAATEQFSRLRVTAAPEPAAMLDRYLKAAHWRAKAWAALATLQAYADAKAVSLDQGSVPEPELSNVGSFIHTDQPGVQISLHNVALSESPGVADHAVHHNARMFVVDRKTDSSGVAYFSAHIRLEAFRPPAPRMYFYDDVTRSGVVYVGYCGPQLSGSGAWAP
ncbi:hypothetical protein [Amycolatopsis sp. GM8]|uniref:hypothetical protein n=1 Tax=Amycolatopsis sp. GM8 TaxID=2896530 RepID=UPI001F387108|nr:hypothetical protein [Amycolatopsis sp. GM8]